MSAARIRTSVLALTCAVTLLAGSATTALAQRNDQDGLINVNLQDVIVQVPVAVAVPIGIAANVCDINVLTIREDNVTECDAENNSFALSKAIADAYLGRDDGPGGGPRNEQDGLINVNIQGLALQFPVAVAVPIGVAANVCDVNVLTFREDNLTECDAENTSKALSVAVAKALFRQ